MCIFKMILVSLIVGVVMGLLVVVVSVEINNRCGYVILE